MRDVNPFSNSRSSHREVFLGKVVLKICRKLTGEKPCWIVISITFHSNVIEFTLRHGCSPVILLHIFSTPFPKNTSGRLLLKLEKQIAKTIITLTYIKGGSRAAVTSKMEYLVIIVNGWNPLTIITKHSILDVAAALETPLYIYPN